MRSSDPEAYLEIFVASLLWGGRCQIVSFKAACCKLDVFQSLVVSQTVCYCFPPQVEFLTNPWKQWISPKHLVNLQEGFSTSKGQIFCFKKGPEHCYQDIPQSLHYMHCTNPVRFAPGCTANLCFVCFLKRIITSGEKRNPSWKMSGNLVWYDPAGFFHQVMYMHWPRYIIIMPHFWIWWVNI